MTLTTADISSLHQRAQKALVDGNPQETHKLCLAILQADREHADAWFLCGVIAGQNGLTTKAIEILGNAVRLDRKNAEYHSEYGKYLLLEGNHRLALAAARNALDLGTKDIPTLNTLGTLFSHLGEHADAITCFEKAVARCDEARSLSTGFKIELHFNFAMSLQFAGRFDQAEQALEAIIALQPDYFRAHSALATLRRHSATDNHLDRLEALRGKIVTPTDQLHLGHALAKELEDLGRYEESFAALEWAKDKQGTQVGYSIEQDAALFAAAKHSGSAQNFKTSLGNQAVNNEPIFIIGMPRTGTTLLEQILGSHSQVFAAGELQNFPLVTQQLSRAGSSKQLAEQRISASTLEAASTLDMRELGLAYLESTRTRTGHTPHFIDKLPLNFIYAGLIRRALPGAKIICLRRDPMDTCLSNYRQLFATNFRHYHYNYDLLDCGRYYIAFDKLMAHWRDVMPGAIFEMQYESLVQEPESTTRALLQFCDLPWEPDCLKFNTRHASVATPSAVQVRQGIYTSSVERWRKYGEAMHPLRELLEEAGLYG